MAFYIPHCQITQERVNVTVGKLATQARIEREAAAFARRLAASPLVGKVATRALQPQLEELAPDRLVFVGIEDRDKRTRYVLVRDESVKGSWREGDFDIVLATNEERRIDREKLLAQAKRHDERAAEYTRCAEELPGQIAQLNNLLPYLTELEHAAQTVQTWAPGYSY